jgi:radical SAM superfamily enzyme with C-terminal helix-hairpin-helix motif
MMKFLSLLAALGAGIFVAAWLAGLQRRGQGVRPMGRLLNINEASQQELMRVLGLDRETAERIVEHRPYPSKMDLLGRMVVPEEVYRVIKDRIVYKAG